jgi:hypothetical protein
MSAVRQWFVKVYSGLTGRCCTHEHVWHNHFACMAIACGMQLCGVAAAMSAFLWVLVKRSMAWYYMVHMHINCAYRHEAA